MNLEEIKNIKQKILDCDQIITSQILGFLIPVENGKGKQNIDTKLVSEKPKTKNNYNDNTILTNSLSHISTIFN